MLYVSDSAISLYFCGMHLHCGGCVLWLMSCTVNIRGGLLSLEKPLVMGILNVTDDSFFGESRVAGDSLLKRAAAMLESGAAILDVGACSTRPASEPVPQDVELVRLHEALSLLDKEFPDAVVSLDTFRGAVALECAREHNVSIINDVSAFDWDKDMFAAVTELNLPYVLTHSVGFAGGRVEYDDFLPQVLQRLASKVWQLRQCGVKDIIVDPGFGFGKTVQQNFAMLENLRDFRVFDAPLLVGVSRKSMITSLLGITPDEALPGTIALGMAALMRGASILRVHDVKEACQTVRLYSAMKGL